MRTARKFSVLVVIFALCGGVAMAAHLPPSSRLVGGEEVASGKYPHAVSVRLDNAHVCGGSIIGRKFVLTAAHCLTEKGISVATSRLSVRVGTTNQYAGGQVISVAAKSVHPQYKDLKNNIAVLTLESDLHWSDKLQSIPYAANSSESAPIGAAVSAAGWGKQTIEGNEAPYKLHVHTFNVSTAEVCEDAYKDMDSTTLCLNHALKAGSCIGDGGNGAIYNGRLVGITNFVVGTCGSRYPDVFLNVISYAQWISGIMK